MKRMIFALGICLLVTSPAIAQKTIDEETISELQQLSSQFMALVYEGKYQEAFDVIRNTPRAIGDEQLAALQSSAAEQLEQITGVYGAKLEAQYIGFNSLSNFLLRFIYVTRYERHIVWWQIVFYRGADDTWLFSTISYDDDMDALMGLTF